MKSSKSFEEYKHNERGDPKPPKPMVEFSDFGDGLCGEPRFEQHLVLDFTPDAEIDNEISQKKICDFWKFINSTPDIKNLMVKPERCNIKKPPSNFVMDQPEENVLSMAKTACSMLELVEQNGLITRTFEGKMPKSHCSLDSREYKENNEDIRQKTKANRDHIICRSTKICKTFHVKKPPGAPFSTARQLCTKLQEWDDKHPKSMEPPCHPPALQHCVIQRQVLNA